MESILGLEMSSDPKKYFGFTFDEFTKLVYTVKIGHFNIDTTIACHGLK